MEDSTFFPQYQMIKPIDYSFHDINFHSEPYYTNGNSFIEASHEVDDFKRPMKQLETNSWNSCITENNIPPPPPKASSSSSSSHIISFDNSSSYYAVDYDVKPKNEVGSRRVGSFARTPLRTQDHVLAERKRREKLSQSFISLSALIPGLKKVTSLSV